MAIEIASLRSEWCQKFEAMLRANNARFDASDARHERSGAELYGRGSKGPPTGPVKRPSKRPSARHRAPCLALRLAPHQATISSSTPGTRSLIWPHMHVAGRACARWSRSSLACSRRRSASASRPARRLALSWLAWRRCPRSRAARTAARPPGCSTPPTGSDSPSRWRRTRWRRARRCARRCRYGPPAPALESNSNLVYVCPRAPTRAVLAPGVARFGLRIAARAPALGRRSRPQLRHAHAVLLAADV